jgi:hypothetical protein
LIFATLVTWLHVMSHMQWAILFHDTITCGLIPSVSHINTISPPKVITQLPKPNKDLSDGTWEEREEQWSASSNPQAMPKDRASEKNNTQENTNAQTTHRVPWPSCTEWHLDTPRGLSSAVVTARTQGVLWSKIGAWTRSKER